MASDLETLRKDPERLADSSVRERLVRCAGSILPATVQMHESNQLFLSIGTKHETRRCAVGECLRRVD